jgi:hypothetical protein
MGIDRLAKKRTKRTRTWASVCASLFGERSDVTDETADDAPNTASSADRTP